MIAKTTGFHPFPHDDAPFPWRRHRVISIAVVAICLAVPINNYIGGLRLEGNSAFSPLVPLTFALLILFPLLIAGTVRGIYRIVRKKESPQKAATLALPFVALCAIVLLPIPSFDEGVAQTIRKRASREELVALARSMVDQPPAWMKDDYHRSLRRASRSWLDAHPVVSRAKLDSCPNVRIKRETVSFHAGSAIADHWGISISATHGSKPDLPEEIDRSLEIYPEVWVFGVPDY